MVKQMAFGIGKFSLKYIRQNWKRNKVYKRNKGKNLILGLGSTIRNTNFGFNNFIGENSYVINSSIGDYSYTNSNVIIRNTKIGKFCSIASGVKIVLGHHPTNLISLHPTFYANNKPYETFSDKTYFKEYYEVDIGNDVWIGEDVIIPGGVTIGDGAIIGARALVTKDIEPYSIVGGVPAKHIRYRYDDAKVKILLDYKWWDKDRSWLKENFKKFHDSETFFKFINK